MRDFFVWNFFDSDCECWLAFLNLFPRSSFRLYEYEYQILQKRITQIRTEVKREAMRIFAFVVKFLKIKYIGVDDIRGLNNRGKKGKLANAITDLGKSQKYFSYFHELIEDIATEYKNELTQTMYIMMQDPRTSGECPKCGEKGKSGEFHPKGKYRKFICPKCDHKGDRDPIAAQISAQKTKRTREDYEKFKTAVVSAIDPGE